MAQCWPVAYSEAAYRSGGWNLRLWKCHVCAQNHPLIHSRPPLLPLAPVHQAAEPGKVGYFWSRGWSINYCLAYHQKCPCSPSVQSYHLLSPTICNLIQTIEIQTVPKKWEDKCIFNVLFMWKRLQSQLKPETVVFSLHAFLNHLEKHVYL